MGELSHGVQQGCWQQPIELRGLASRQSTPSPGSATSGTSTTRRTIDNILEEFIQPKSTAEPTFTEMMMWQRQEDTERERAREVREQAKEDREKLQAAERERVRRKDLRLREEREDRREEANRNLLLVIMNLAAGKKE